MKFSESVKQVLLGKIQEMAASPGSFVRNPDRDFTRRRKLDFATTIQCLIAMESGSLKKELLKLLTKNMYLDQRGYIDAAKALGIDPETAKKNYRKLTLK